MCEFISPPVLIPRVHWVNERLTTNNDKPEVLADTMLLKSEQAASVHARTYE